VRVLGVVRVLVVLTERVGRCRLRPQCNSRGLASHRTGCCPRSFALEISSARCPLAAAALLRDVSELVSENELAAGCCQVHCAPLEVDVVPTRDGQLPGRHLGAVAVELDVIKPTAERALHPALQRCR
jgi:hypothetical protein